MGQWEKKKILLGIVRKKKSKWFHENQIHWHYHISLQQCLQWAVSKQTYQLALNFKMKLQCCGSRIQQFGMKKSGFTSCWQHIVRILWQLIPSAKDCLAASINSQCSVAAICIHWYWGTMFSLWWIFIYKYPSKPSYLLK